MKSEGRKELLDLWESSNALESSRPSPGKVTLTSRLAARSGASINAAAAPGGKHAAAGADTAPGGEGADSAEGGGAPAAGAAGPDEDATLAAFLDGKPLDATAAQRIGEAYGESFSDVRVHTSPLAAKLAQKHGSIAFTLGSDIAFDEGQYRPNTPEGDALLAHELAHVVQQRGGGGDRRAALAAPAANSVALEHDADHAAESVVRRIYGGLKNGVAAVTNRIRPNLSTNQMTLQRCPGGDEKKAKTPSVTVGAVSFGGSANRLAPTQAATAAVTATDLPSGESIDLDVENAGGNHGDASITSGASLSANGNVTVTAGSGQTDPAQRGTLFVRAKYKGTEVGKSAGFTVACHPKNTTIVLSGDLNSSTQVGFKVGFTYSNDATGAVSELDKVQISEQVGLVSRDNPPWTSSGGTTATGGTSSYLPGTGTGYVDTHGKGKAAIATAGLAHGSYTIVYNQVFIFKDARMNVTDQPVVNSGYLITHTAWWDAVKSKWQHQGTKTGAGTTVNGFTSAAGAGSATSLVHDL